VFAKRAMGRAMAVMMTGALVATGIVVAPAFGASERPQTSRRAPTARFTGSFTPAAADPRLAAAIARGGLDSSEFRFTPAEARQSKRVTLAVRARSNRVALTDATSTAAVAAPTVGIQPIAYNLGVAVGWRRFAVSGDVSHIDMAGIQPGSRDRSEVAVSYAGKRVSGRIAASEDKPLAGTPVLIGDKPSYSLDIGGSYAISRRLDVTAGVRYKSERDRLIQFNEDARRDSQSIYIGTAFRF